jgi:hypothetical protein
MGLADAATLVPFYVTVFSPPSAEYCGHLISLPFIPTGVRLAETFKAMV